MISQNSNKLICSLHQKKFRTKYGKFIIEGARAIDYALNNNGAFSIIVYTRAFLNKNPKIIEKIKPFNSSLINEKELKRISPSTSPSGILGIANNIQYSDFNNTENFIFLDKVSDPGNMGTIIRTAAWFGVFQIALSEGCIDPFNPKVVRGAMGAHFSLKWIGEKSILDFRDYKLIGAVPKSKSTTTLYSLNDKWGLIMGSEAHGISRDNYSHLSDTIAIPKIGKGESLNIGVAMGILLHQLTK